jgi:hypothetical protein
MQFYVAADTAQKIVCVNSNNRYETELTDDYESIKKLSWEFIYKEVYKFNASESAT